MQRRFVLSFAAIAGVLFAAYSFPYAELGLSERWFQHYLAAYAQLAGSVLGLVDPKVRVDGTLIVGRYALRIVKTCDAMEANVLFAAAVLAFPGLWRRKLVALGLGVAVLVVLNILRICSLYYAGAIVPDTFELLHTEVWPLLLVAFASAEFWLWTSWIARGTRLALTEPAA